jgi:hypothetical protein
MSNAEKWWSRMAVAFGARKGLDGRIQLPSYHENPNYWTIFIGLVVLIVLVFICSLCK